MNNSELHEYFKVSEELTRLSLKIQKEKSDVLEKFPEILQIHSYKMENSSACVIAIEVTKRTPDMEAALQACFSPDSVYLTETDDDSTIWPLRRALFTTGISDVLDEAGNRDGFYMKIEQDETGPFLDIRLSKDDERSRIALQNAYPDIRLKFFRNHKPLTIAP